MLLRSYRPTIALAWIVRLGKVHSHSKANEKEDNETPRLRDSPPSRQGVPWPLLPMTNALRRLDWRSFRRPA
jgi:hypothetical protein